MSSIALFLVALVLGLLPGWVAHRKARQFWSWYLFGVFVFPVALIAVLVVKDRNPEIRRHQRMMDAVGYYDGRRSVR